MAKRNYVWYPHAFARWGAVIGKQVPRLMQNNIRAPQSDKRVESLQARVSELEQQVELMKGASDVQGE